MIPAQAIQKKILAAADKAGMTSEADLSKYIETTTQAAPYFLSFLRSALTPGSSDSLPGAAAADLDNWMKALAANSQASGKKSAQKINDVLLAQGASVTKTATRRAKPTRSASSATKKPTRSASSKKPAAKKPAVKKPAAKKPAAKKTKPSSRQAAAKAATDKVIEGAIRDARKRGIRGPFKIHLDLVVQEI